MNDKLLLRKRVKIEQEYIKFMSFIHPSFEYVSDLDVYDNPLPKGIIYTGEYDSCIAEKLDKITKNWIIINSHNFDVDLSTNEGLIKYLLPVSYLKTVKSSMKDDIDVFKNIKYSLLLEKVKVCLITNSSLVLDDLSETSVYDLFRSILGTPECLSKQFFYTVNSKNVKTVTSSVLTFLTLVQTKNIRGKKPGYASVIMNSNLKYGKYIKSAISKFIKSKANLEISLYNMLVYLNKAR